MANGASRSWFLIPSAVVLLVVLGVWMARSQPRSSREHAGRQDVLVTVRAPSGGGKAAAVAVVERLVFLGIDARVVEAEEGRLQLLLRRVAEPSELLFAALSPEALSFHLLPEPQRPEAAVPHLLPDGGEATGLRPWSIGEGRAQTWATAVQAALEEDERFLIECIPPRKKQPHPPCALWRAGPPAPLGPADVQEAQLGADRRTEEPLVHLSFVPLAQERFEALARAADGGSVAVVAFGEVAARPELSGEARGTSWTFSARTADTDRRTAVERAQRIMAAAKLPALPPLQVEAVEPAPTAPGS